MIFIIKCFRTIVFIFIVISIVYCLFQSYEQEFHMDKARQITKLMKMKTSNMKIQSHYSPVEAIVNISKRQLTTPKKSVLNIGFNFATTIKRISCLFVQAPIEDAALKIPKARADELRNKSGINNKVEDNDNDKNQKSLRQNFVYLFFNRFSIQMKIQLASIFLTFLLSFCALLID